MAWNVSLECPSLAGTPTAIAAGLGVAVVNQRNLVQGVRTHATLEQQAPLPCVASLLRSNDNLPDPVRETFCQMLLAALQKTT